MPTQIHRSIAIGEITILLRNTGDPALFKHHKNKLIKRFARRQYPKRILGELRNVIHDMRLRVLFKTKRPRQVDRPLPFTTRYTKCTTSLNRIFRRRWRNLYEDPRFYSLLPNPPFAVYENRRMVNSLLSAKRRKFKLQQFQTKVQPGDKQGFEFMKFNGHPFHKPTVTNVDKRHRLHINICRYNPFETRPQALFETKRSRSTGRPLVLDTR